MPIERINFSNKNLLQGSLDNLHLLSKVEILHEKKYVQYDGYGFKMRNDNSIYIVPASLLELIAYNSEKQAGKYTSISTVVENLSNTSSQCFAKTSNTIISVSTLIS